MSETGSASVSVAAPAETERESDRGTETERGTRRGGGIAGDLMMPYPVGGLQEILF